MTPGRESGGLCIAKAKSKGFPLRGSLFLLRTEDIIFPHGYDFPEVIIDPQGEPGGMGGDANRGKPQFFGEETCPEKVVFAGNNGDFLGHFAGLIFEMPLLMDLSCESSSLISAMLRYGVKCY